MKYEKLDVENNSESTFEVEDVIETSALIDKENLDDKKENKSVLSTFMTLFISVMKHK